jgi:Tfp pilus assembly protein FimT
MNISRLISKHHDAFTLVEFIVIMSIFAVMVGVVMFNFNGFRSAVTLDNLAHDIGISIRQIQTNSGSSLSIDSNPETETPRGIAFYPDPENRSQFASEFTLFKDDGDGIFNEGMDEVVDVIKIQTQDRIKDIQYQPFSGPLTPVSAQKVGITFKRYKTDATFMTDQDGLLSDATNLIITVASPNDNNGGPERTRMIIISKIGQISIK